MSALLAHAANELHKRHDFFVAWFTGRASTQDMAQSRRAFAPDMQRIDPDGVLQSASDVIAMIEGAKGLITQPFTIRVQLHRSDLIAGNLALLVYDEHQRIGGTATSRRASALFSADETAPEKAVWRHLQETWIAS